MQAIGYLQVLINTFFHHRGTRTAVKFFLLIHNISRSNLKTIWGSLMIVNITGLLSYIPSPLIPRTHPYHTSGCHMNQNTFPLTQACTEEKHKISSQVCDGDCCCIFKTHTIWENKTRTPWDTGIFWPGTISCYAYHTGPDLLNKQEKCTLIYKKTMLFGTLENGVESFGIKSQRG